MSRQIMVKVQWRDSKKVIRFAYQTGLPFFACLTEQLLKEGVAFSLCGGKGFCGKCRIRFLEGAPLPGPGERRFLTAEELRKGIRLACMSKPLRDCTVELLFVQNTSVITEFCVEKKVRSDLGVVQGQKQEVVIAADVGTTTIAMARAERYTGKILATYTCLNPQASYGSDVIARITLAGEQGAGRLQDAAGRALKLGAKELGGNGETIYVAANTVMSHFLAGSDAASLGRAPFQPEFLERADFCLQGQRIVLLPGISAFVGADITAGLLSCGLLPVREEMRGILFLDLGTNGEMALCSGEKLFCTSAAAGPAFEGKAGEKRGSHMVQLLAELLREGKMDRTGLLLTAKERITQKEIRDLQMAKAAVRTGVEVLLKKADMEPFEIRQVYLAGGFGYYIDAADAAAVGLIPEEFCNKVISVGNSSLQGAVVYAGMDENTVDLRNEQENGGDRERLTPEMLEKVLRKDCIAVNLAEEEYFLEHYVERMNF